MNYYEARCRYKDPESGVVVVQTLSCLAKSSLDAMMQMCDIESIVQVLEEPKIA